MLIEELGREASLELLAQLRFGRLACAKEHQPYITPFLYVYHEGSIYSFTTAGQKIDWMRANPLVCVQAAEIKTPQQWRSVVVFGRYEELPQSPKWQSTREKVRNLLTEREIWWEPGYAKTIIGGHERPLDPLFYRISIENITGHQASLGAKDYKQDVMQKVGWLKTLVSRL